MLESFDNHPPIILPSGGFKVDLEVETLDDNIYRHLLYIRHFLWSLQSRSPHTSEGSGSALPKVACIPQGGCSSPGWAGGSWVPLQTPPSPGPRACCPGLQPGAVECPRGELLEGLVLLIPPHGGHGEVSWNDRLFPAISLAGRKGRCLWAVLPFPLCVPCPPCAAPCPSPAARLAGKH